MPFTVQKALKELAEFAGSSGACWDDPLNLLRLNQARELIYEKGDYAGTVGWEALNVSKGHFCTSLFIEEVREIYVCDEPIEIKDSPSMLLGCDDARRCCQSKRRIHARKSPAMPPYCCKPDSAFSIKVSSDSADDDGKVITLVLRSRDGRRVPMEVALKSEDQVQLDGVYSDIISISKEITNGYVTIWGVVLDLDCMVLASIPPGIEIPQYQNYQILGGCKAPDQVVVYGKKSFIPIICKEENDKIVGGLRQIVDIQSITALKFAYMALNAQSEKDLKSYANNITLMANNLDLADQSLFESEPSYDIGSNFSKDIATASFFP